MLVSICHNCGTEFTPRSADIARGLGKYCSRHCAGKREGIKRLNLEGRGEVSNAIFRDRFIERYNREELTLGELAGRLGRTRSETSYVQVLLGLRPYKADRRNGSGNSGWRYRQKLSYETAVKLAEALDIDPIDAGL